LVRGPPKVGEQVAAKFTIPPDLNSFNDPSSMVVEKPDVNEGWILATILGFYFLKFSIYIYK